LIFTKVLVNNNNNLSNLLMINEYFLLLFCRPNVCTEKEESEGATTETDGDESVDTFGQERDGAGNVVRSPLFGQFHFSVNSCAEKPNKHVCTKM